MIANHPIQGHNNSYHIRGDGSLLILLFCSAKPKAGICPLVQKTDTAFWLSTTVLELHLHYLRIIRMLLPGSRIICT